MYSHVWRLFIINNKFCLHTHSLTPQLSFSPNTPASSHAKIIILLSTVILCCAGLFMVCAIVGWQFGFNHFTFLFSEVFILFARTLHTIIRSVKAGREGLGISRVPETYKNL